MKKLFTCLITAALLVCLLVPSGCAAAKPSWAVVSEKVSEHYNLFEGFLNEDHGIMLIRFGIVRCTDDGGSVWTKGTTEAAEQLALDIVDDNIAWSGGKYSEVCITRDGGVTWEMLENVPLGGYVSNIDFFDENVGWVCATWRLIGTANGGKTWYEIEYPDEVDGIAAIHLRTPSDGYLLARNGLLFITSDGGKTWEQKDIGIKQYGVVNSKGEPGLYKFATAVADIAFTDKNNGTIVFTGLDPDNGIVLWSLKTSDGGDSFEAEQIKLEGDFKARRLFLSGDGQYLTLANYKRDIVLLKCDK